MPRRSPCRSRPCRDNILAPGPLFVPGNRPGDYQLTTSTPPQPVNTGAGTWKSFVTLSASQFRPNGPAPLRSLTYALDLLETSLFGGAVSHWRTADQEERARWHTEMAQFQFSRIAGTETATDARSMLEHARLFALMLAVCAIEHTMNVPSATLRTWVVNAAPRCHVERGSGMERMNNIPRCLVATVPACGLASAAPAQSEAPLDLTSATILGWLNIGVTTAPRAPEWRADPQARMRSHGLTAAPRPALRAMVRRVVGICASLCVAVSAADARAQTSERDLADLTIEELMGLRVTSTTKMGAMPIDKAPGVVRVFTRADIERFGFVTLRDVLANVPGVQIQEYRAGHQAVWFRGIKQRYNNKVLWLVDGVPLRDGYYGHQSIDEVMPLDMVERIEIITGPGSVLYGANAFAGVVSVTTKSSRSQDTRRVRAAYGTYDTGTLSAEGAAGPAYGLVNYLNTSGFSPRLNNDGNAWHHDQERSRTYGLFKVGDEHLEGTLSVIDHDYADTYRTSGQDRFTKRRPVYGAARWSRDLSPNASLSVLGYVEYYRLTKTDVRFSRPGVLSRISDDHYNTSLQGVEVNVSGRVKRHALVGGAAWQMDRSHRMTSEQVFPLQTSSPQMIVPSISRQDVGVFIQDVWSLSPSVDITSGVRYDALSAFEDEFSYRTAVAANHGGWYGKVLFGTAFRVPLYREYLDVTSHNLALRPEHVYTFEAQAGHRYKRADVNLTFYNNAYRDLIKEILVATIATPSGIRTLDGDEYSINAEGSTVRGLELQVQIHPTERLSVIVGASRLLSATETIGTLDPSVTPSIPVSAGTVEAEFLAKYTANALVDYRLAARGDRIGLQATGLSSRLVPANYQSGVPAENRDASLPHRAYLDFKLLNLFDRTVFSPSFDNVTGYDTEWQGRSFRAQLTVLY